ncbi:MAG: ABC transporter permease subunit, partial [Chloroflexi bacterium]|nr:ABC transporter permease subunit [Chloroflexota bacterium]
ALLIGLLALNIAAFAGLVVGAALAGADWEWWRLLAATLNAVPPAAVIGAFALFVSALSRGRALAVGLATGLIVFSYFLNTLAPFAAWLKPLQPLSVFYHYSNSQPLTAGIDWASIGLLVAVALLFSAGAVIAFERRDIAI